MEDNIFERQSYKKTYFSLSLPVVLGMVVSIVYNITDTYFISLTKDTYLIAGVSLCAPLFTLLMAFGNIFGQGGSSLISRLIGAKDIENLKRVSSYCFYTALIFGAVSGILMLLIKDPILRILGADSNTYIYAKDYLICMAIGAPFAVLSFIHTNLLRAEGMAKTVMIANIGGSIVNIILDPILIFSFGLYVKGAAIATVCGYIFTDIFCLIMVYKKSVFLSVDFSKRSISKEFKSQIYGVGTSAALSNITQSICLVITNQLLLKYGSDKIAVNGVVSKISMIVMLVIVGFSFGGAPLIGYYYGSNNKEKLKQLLAFVLKFLVSLALGMSALIVIASSSLVGIFLQDLSLISLGKEILFYQVAGMAFMAVVLFCTIIFQSTGKSLPALILSLSRQGLVFVIVIFTLSFIFGYKGVIMSQFVADILSAILAMGLVYCYRKELF